MLKMVLKDKEGKPPRTILLGLSHVNLDRLKQGYPIRFDSGDIELSARNRVHYILWEDRAIDGR
jgi:hypothetical protein